MNLNRIFNFLIFMFITSGAGFCFASEGLYLYHHAKGHVRLYQGHYSEALSHFEAALRAKPGDEDAMHYREMARGRLRRFRPEVRSKRWTFRAGTRFEFDDNVALLPDDASLFPPGTDEDDVRWIGFLGAAVDLADAQDWVLTGRYDFFQSIHYENDDFDLQAHSGAIEAARKFDRGRVFAGYGINEYLLDSDLDQFLLAHDLTGGLWIQEFRRLYGKFSYRAQFKDYAPDVVEPRNDRDALNHRIGVDQYIFLGPHKSFLRAGYFFDYNDTDGRNFFYRGHRPGAWISWQFPGGISAAAGYEYYFKEYTRRAIGREDDQHIFHCLLAKKLNATWTVSARFERTMNNSNIPFFEYDRNVISVGIDLDF